MIPTPPKYLQVRDMLIREIMAGRLLDGERLPPEREMAGELGLAVGTLRKALEALSEAGHLLRRQGSGNYIQAGADVSGIYAFFRLERLEGGGVPTAQTLAVDWLAKPADLPRLGPGAEAHRIRRLRSLDGIPAALEEIWLDGAADRRLSKAELGDSLYAFYRSALNLWISRAEDRVSVAAMPGWGPLPEGGAVGYVERISWDQLGNRVEASRTWFDPAVARYVQRIK